jgi:uracil-DNA glycosylase
MRRNCLRHLAATMQILQPTLMVLQGEGVQNWIAPVLGLMKDRTEHLAETHVAGNRVFVCRVSHPSAPTHAISWGNRLDAPYLVEVVEPTLRLATSLVLDKN